MTQEQNPFFIDSGTSKVTEALSGIGSVIGSAMRQRSQASKSRKAQQEASRVFQNGDPEEIALFTIKNPQMGKTVKNAIAIQTGLEKQEMAGYYERILLGNEDPVDVYTEMAEAGITKSGRSPKGIQAVQEAMQDPGEARRDAERGYAVYSTPDQWKAYKEASKAPGDKDNRTTAIKEFEYGLEHPDFVTRQHAKSDREATRAAAGKNFKNTSDLRKEFLSQSKDFQKVRDSYTRVVGSTENPSPAGDLSLIFNYMKMLDPGSVVRESEFATAASAGSYGERIQASVQKVLSGERLTKNMRKDFVDKSGTLMEGMQKQHSKREKNYGRIATKNNLDPSEVVVDINVAGEEQNQSPQYTEGQTAGGGKLIFRNGQWEDNI